MNSLKRTGIVNGFHFLCFTALCLAFPAPLTYAADLTYLTDSIVSVNGIFLTIKQGSEATAVTVTDTTMNVTVPGGSTFTLYSGNPYTLSSSNNFFVSTDCKSTTNTLTITVNSANALTTTITPTTTTCSRSSTLLTGSSGGGSSSGSTSADTSVSQPAQSSSLFPQDSRDVAPVLFGNSWFDKAMKSGAFSSPSFVPTGLPLSLSLAQIKKPLTAKSTREEILAVQQFLKIEASPQLKFSGKNDVSTRKAIEVFQVKYRIAKKGQSGFGFVGPRTQAKMNAIISSRSKLNLIKVK